MAPHPDGKELDKLVKNFGAKNQHLYKRSDRGTNTSVAAWLVSNCKPQSRRDDFVKKLRR